MLGIVLLLLLDPSRTTTGFSLVFPVLIPIEEGDVTPFVDDDDDDEDDDDDDDDDDDYYLLGFGYKRYANGQT